MLASESSAMHQLRRRSPQKPQLDLIADRMPLEQRAALGEPAQIVEMTPVVGGAFDSQGLAVFFDRSQLEVIKVLIEQEVGRISSHGLGTMGMVSEPS